MDGQGVHFVPSEAGLVVTDLHAGLEAASATQRRETSYLWTTSLSSRSAKVSKAKQLVAEMNGLEKDFAIALDRSLNDDVAAALT